MPNFVDREGKFRGRIVDYGMFEATAPSRAVSIKLLCRVDEIFAEDNWHDWSEYDVVTSGDVWVIKKDGSLNTEAIERLIRHAGWSGSFDDLASKTWQPTPIQFDVKADQRDGKVFFKINWISGYDDSPRHTLDIDPDRAKALSVAYGAQLRAIAGNIKRNGQKPSGVPAPPVGPTQEVFSYNQSETVDDGGVPF